MLTDRGREAAAVLVSQEVPPEALQEDVSQLRAKAAANLASDV